MQTHDRPDEIASPPSDPMSTSQQSAQSPETQPPQLPATEGNRPSILDWWFTLPQSWQRTAIMLLLCLSGVIGAPVAIQHLQPANPPQPVQQSVTRTDYELLQLGMTVTDAQARLGRAVEVSRDETSITYRWANADGSEIIAVFKDDRLVSKQQTGLK